MKIIVLQDWLRSGGTERQSVFLAGEFAAAGHDSTLLTFRPGGALDSTVRPTVRRMALQRPDTGMDWFAPRLRCEVGRLKPDVVLAMGRMANCWSGMVQKSLRASDSRAAVVGTMRTGKHLPLLFRRSLGAVAHVIANSSEARETLQRQYGVPADRVSVIHNSLIFPPAASADPAARAAVRREHGAADSTVVLLCVAMFRQEKNQAALIDILSRLPPGRDWQLWLAGDGVERQRCEAVARKLGVADRVRFLGWQKDPSPLYGAADIAVHASRSESLSNFLIEAQACGLPGVAYAAQGIAECFVSGETGAVIPQGDTAAFAAALQRFADASPEEKALRAQRAREHARAEFDPAIQAAAHLELFERLLVSEGGARCP